MGGHHDKLFKKSFENPKVAAAHFRDSLPPKLVRLIDLSKLRLEPGSYVDEVLRDQHSDLLFSAPWLGPESSGPQNGKRKSKSRRGPRERAMLYLLFEHQSTIDRLMPLRVLSYQIRIWNRWIAQNPRATDIPTIFSLVLYNGQSRWSAPLSFEDLLNTPKSLRATLNRFVPRLRIVVQWLQDIQQADLPGDLHGRLVLSFLRNRGVANMFPHFRDNIAAVNDLPMPERLQVFSRLLHYSWIVSDTNDSEAYQKASAQVGPEAKELAMTHGERLVAEGKAEGLSLALNRAKQRVVESLTARGMHLSQDVRDHIDACDDLDTVHAWLVRCGTVKNPGELLQH